MTAVSMCCGLQALPNPWLLPEKLFISYKVLELALMPSILEGKECYEVHLSMPFPARAVLQSLAMPFPAPAVLQSHSRT